MGNRSRTDAKNLLHNSHNMKKPSHHEMRQAEKFVQDFRTGDFLGHNTKLLEDGQTYQARLGNKLRVQFTAAKEIIAIFRKPNHQTHR